MFFFDDKLGRRRVADIVSISPGHMGSYHGHERLIHRVEMANGERLTLLDVSVQDLLRSPTQITSAEPGLMALVGFNEDESPILSPVLAWAITFGGAVRPVLASGVNDDREAELPIIHPDGTVRYLGFNEYPSLDSYRSSGADQPDT